MYQLSGRSRVLPALLLFALSTIGAGCGGDGGGGSTSFALAAVNVDDAVLAAASGNPSVVKITFTIVGNPGTSVSFLVQYSLVGSPLDGTSAVLDATEAPGSVIGSFTGESDPNPGQNETIGANGTVTGSFYWWFGADLGFTCLSGSQALDIWITPYTNGDPNNPNGSSDMTVLTSAELLCSASNPSYPSTGNAVGAAGRAGHTATLGGVLPPGTGFSDADVLVIGGYNSTAPFPFATADLFEFNLSSMTHGTTISFGGPARRYHAAEFFIGNDGTIKVLATGGDIAQVNPPAGSTNATDEAEIYCFSPTNQGMTPIPDGMAVPRKFHAAVWLPNNKILVVGGSGDNEDSSSIAAGTAEIFDPVTESFSLLSGGPNHPRHKHTLCLLPDGRVLMAGGFEPAVGSPTALPAEVYNPITNTWTDVSGSSIDRVNHTCTQLIDGNILLVGGMTIGAGSVLNTMALFDCSVQSFTATFAIPNLLAGRERHTATRIASGEVLVLGGFGSASSSLTSAELVSFTPTVSVVPVASLVTGRAEHATVATGPGSIVVMGGKSGSTASPLFLDTVEIYPFNNTPPEVTIPFTPTYSTTSSVPITFSLEDVQGDKAFVVVQWSSDFGINWKIATIVNACDTLTNLSPGSHTVYWNAAADTASGTVVVRVIPFGGVLGTSAKRQIVLP